MFTEDTEKNKARSLEWTRYRRVKRIILGVEIPLYLGGKSHMEGRKKKAALTGLIHYATARIFLLGINVSIEKKFSPSWCQGR